jgi:hypothetical protein
MTTPTYGNLRDYTDASKIRVATRDELAASVAAAKLDGGAGVIDVDGRRCYVEGGRHFATRMLTTGGMVDWCIGVTRDEAFEALRELNARGERRVQVFNTITEKAVS